MSILDGAAATLGTATGLINAAATAQRALGIAPLTYAQQLQVASWRGVQFATTTGSNVAGRRTHVHEYPFRDDPWVEDIGRRARKFSVAGFLVGDDVIAQRAKLQAACETAGPGVLVHPTYGSMTVTLIDFEVSENTAGRAFDIALTFIRGGPRIQPATAVSTQSATQTAAVNLNAASALDYAAGMLGKVIFSASVVANVASAALAYSNTAIGLIKDASNLFNLACQLPGNFGRFFGANASNAYASTPSAQPATATVASLISQGAEDRAAVAQAGAALQSAVASLSASTLSAVGTAAQALATAVVNTSANPGDAVRLLSRLSLIQAAGPMAEQALTAALLRRAALAQLAVATSNYQPTSYDDAQAVLASAVDLFDAEILVAGDTSDDNSFQALRSLRAAVVQDLIARGSALAALKTWTVNATLPAEAIAQFLYQDASRAQQLVAQVVPPHPCFFPSVFRALSA